MKREGGRSEGRERRAGDSEGVRGVGVRGGGVNGVYAFRP
jgi:hypothetical protein